MIDRAKDATPIGPRAFGSRVWIFWRKECAFVAYVSTFLNITEQKRNSWMFDNQNRDHVYRTQRRMCLLNVRCQLT